MSTMNVPEELLKTKRRTERSLAIEQDRRGAKRPLVIERIGDLVFFWATTGLIASGASAAVYLSDTAEARGAGAFSRKPLVLASRDEVGFTGIGMTRAADPLSPGENYSVSVNVNSNYSWTVSWDTVHLLWKVVVANSTGTTRDFLVEAWGV